ncbi:excinuclease ABC subunit UvrC [Neptuniibacter caesariensis]|uniref:UvrABC system protein C n=1 Tax=Neptuniibacter caesariensis TaxID=207954 RepID=A0A7U8C4C5_NEPCE|nr:excinuclease ABC subunit UvrC [Neptuniibacter caesariensis]EAR59689.1 excinuclease ABC subunit C [Oceanospirillum sp. MED92] [Neptuniibacter caesariensis]
MSDSQIDSTFDSAAFLKQLTKRPGVYQMYDAQEKLLYIGKAKNLKNRVSSYFRATGLSVKTRSLVSKIADVQITVTNSETEALLLEQNLIKEYRPPYNILLRDDKSYPYIFISDKDTYPAVRFSRGAKRKSGKYFGPYPSGGAVRDSLNLLQKIFRIRQCEESFFKNRSRPCLQYQIKRCTAPCVEAISPQEYQEDIKHAAMFLEGKNKAVMDEIAQEMEAASEQLNFEQAALYRDQLVSLQKVQEQQYVTGLQGDADVIGCDLQPGGVCLHMLFVRGGRVIGSKSHYPKVSIEETRDEIVSAFIAQWYLGAQREIPAYIITPFELSDEDCLKAALAEARDKKVALSHNVRGERSGWQKLAQTNAEQQLSSYLANKKNIYNRYLELQELLGLDDIPTRLECFDISHSSGEATVASCVVFDKNGPLKSDYRHFNIEGITPGDDYAAMYQALHRRYSRIKKEEAKLPDLLIVDGGKGQVTQAMEVLDELQIAQVLVIGIAKGPTRKAGFEVLISGDTGDETVLENDSGALHLLQHIRDEAHRFAITGHRARRGKARKRSVLEDIPGVGPKRRRELLRHFGGIQEIQRASVEEIAKVSTISLTIAEEIYSALHPDL